MRITYYEETDSAVILLREPGPDPVGEIAGEDLLHPDTGEEVPGVVLHRETPASSITSRSTRAPLGAWTRTG